MCGVPVESGPLPTERIGALGGRLANRTEKGAARSLVCQNAQPKQRVCPEAGAHAHRVTWTCAKVKVGRVLMEPFPVEPLYVPKNLGKQNVCQGDVVQPDSAGLLSGSCTCLSEGTSSIFQVRRRWSRLEPVGTNGDGGRWVVAGSRILSPVRSCRQALWRKPKRWTSIHLVCGARRKDGGSRRSPRKGRPPVESPGLAPAAEGSRRRGSLFEAPRA